KNYFGMLELQWSIRVAQQENTPAGCSKRPDFSPSQPWRLFHPPALRLPRQTLHPGTRLIPSKAAANYHFIRGGWDDPTCAQLSHPPTHWQIFFTRPTLRLLRNRFPVTCHLPRRGSSGFPQFAIRGAARLSFTARIERAQFHRARSASKEGTWPLPPHPSEA